MLIDKSYFVGPLTIAQLGEKAVRDDLNNIINLWEPVIMEAALGYDFYQAFMEGIEVGSDETPAQRWLDLLNGVAFANLSGIKKRFVGFAGGQNSTTLLATQRDDLTIYGGVTAGFNIGDNKYTDASLKGWNFQLEFFGAGTTDRGVEWNYIANGGIQLTDVDYTISPDERWVIHFTGKKVQGFSTMVGSNLRSPLAGFIYYEYMRNLFRQVTGVGVVKSESENAQVASPHQLMGDAYNAAVKQIYVLWEFLQVSTQNTDNNVYPEWDYRQVYGYGFGMGVYGWQPYTDLLYSFSFMNSLF